MLTDAQRLADAIEALIDAKLKFGLVGPEVDKAKDAMRDIIAGIIERDA